MVQLSSTYVGSFYELCLFSFASPDGAGGFQGELALPTSSQLDTDRD